MTTIKLDITLATRAARHLFMTSAIVGIGLAFVWTFWIWAVAQVALGYARADWSIALLGAGCLVFQVALYQARNKLNGWAYVVAALCTSLLLLVSIYMVGITPRHNASADDVAAGGVVNVFFIFLALYMVRVLIDLVRLARTRYDPLDATPFQIASRVSHLARESGYPVPWIHMPNSPIRTCIYGTLFLVSLIPSIGLLGVFPGAVIPISVAIMTARHYALRASRVLELDERQPVLFLRSFGDDKEVRLIEKGLLGKLRRCTIDEAIAPLANQLGPFVAIANPNSALPRLGAAKSYYGNETWQDAIAAWTEKSQFIVMVAGRTGGIRWELDHIFSNQGHRKFAILFPPTIRRHPTAATQWLRDNLAHTKYGVYLSEIASNKTIAIAFLDDGLFILETRQIYRYAVDYFVAFQTIQFAAFGRTLALRGD